MNRNNDKKNHIPENDPSKAMDSKREVENSNDPKTDQDFPGYPHYPAKEDIMDQRTDVHRVDMNVENLAGGPNRSGINQRFADAADRQHEGHAPTSDDKALREEDLGWSNTSNSEIGTPQNVSNEDLDSDLPGTDLQEENSKS